MRYRDLEIYIPIWLDLLLGILICNRFRYSNLHSNMVRFIIAIEALNTINALAFTFQYG